MEHSEAFRATGCKSGFFPRFHDVWLQRATGIVHEMVGDAKAVSEEGELQRSKTVAMLEHVKWLDVTRDAWNRGEAGKPWGNKRSDLNLSILRLLSPV